MVQGAEQSRVPARPGPLGRLRGALGGSGVIAVAMAVMNVAAYAYSMLAARILGPVSYGAFFAMLNLLLIVGVVSLGLQATAARRISADPDHVAQIERQILRVAWRAALALGALLLLASPLIDRVLDLDSLPTAMLAGVAAVPVTVMGAQAGILQGERRWGPLAVLYVVSGLPRLLVGTALILWRPTEFVAFAGVVLGFALAALYGVFALRHDRGPSVASHHHGAGLILREALVNSQALFAFFALTNADMLVGRTVLDSHDSGLYAAGLIVARAVLFLPQFVVVVAFPSMATASERGRALTRSLAFVAALGAVCTAACYLLPGLAMLFAGGSDYAEVRDQLWLFALLGTLMAMLQLLVYSVLARQGRTSVVFIWIALAALIVGGLQTSTVTGLLTVVIVVDASLFAVLLAVSWHRLRQGAGELEEDRAVTPPLG